MAIYVLSMYVTAEQELAIRLLFSMNKWTFRQKVGLHKPELKTCPASGSFVFGPIQSSQTTEPSGINQHKANTRELNGPMHSMYSHPNISNQSLTAQRTSLSTQQYISNQGLTVPPPCLYTQQCISNQGLTAPQPSLYTQQCISNNGLTAPQPSLYTQQCIKNTGLPAPQTSLYTQQGISNQGLNVLNSGQRQSMPPQPHLSNQGIPQVIIPNRHCTSSSVPGWVQSTGLKLNNLDGTTCRPRLPQTTAGLTWRIPRPQQSMGSIINNQLSGVSGPLQTSASSIPIKTESCASSIPIKMETSAPSILITTETSASSTCIPIKTETSAPGIPIKMETSANGNVRIVLHDTFIHTVEVHQNKNDKPVEKTETEKSNVSSKKGTPMQYTELSNFADFESPVKKKLKLGYEEKNSTEIVTPQVEDNTNHNTTVAVFHGNQREIESNRVGFQPLLITIKQVADQTDRREAVDGTDGELPEEVKSEPDNSLEDRCKSVDAINGIIDAIKEENNNCTEVMDLQIKSEICGRMFQNVIQGSEEVIDSSHTLGENPVTPITDSFHTPGENPVTPTTDTVENNTELTSNAVKRLVQEQRNTRERERDGSSKALHGNSIIYGQAINNRDIQIQFADDYLTVKKFDTVIPSCKIKVEASDIEAQAEQTGDVIKVEANDIEASTEQTGDVITIETNDIEASTEQTGDVIKVKATDIEASAEQTGDVIMVEANDIEASGEQTGDMIKVEANDIESLPEQTGDVIMVEANDIEASTEQTGDVIIVEANDLEASGEQTGDVSMIQWYNLKGIKTENEHYDAREVTEKLDKSNADTKQPLTVTTLKFGQGVRQNSPMESHSSEHLNKDPAEITDSTNIAEQEIRKAQRLLDRTLVGRRHNDLKSFEDQVTNYCKDCECTFDNVDQLKKHTDVNGGKCVFSCSQCDQEFKTKLYLSYVENSKKHKEGKVKEYACVVCNNFFEKENMLKQHLKTVKHQLKVGNMEQMLKYLCKCDICDTEFISQKALKLHKKQVHQIFEQVLMCGVCGGVCESRRRITLRKNFKQVNENVCDTCHLCLNPTNCLKKNGSTFTGNVNLMEEFVSEKCD